MTDAATRIEWTEFPNLAGKTMESRYGSWPDLLERIRRAGPYAMLSPTEN